MIELAGKHALITGGGTGIGLAITKALVAAGASVTIASRNVQRIKGVADGIEGVAAIALDVTSPEQVAERLSSLPTIDILVNNAGAAQTSPLVKTAAADWQAMLDVNLTGVFLCTQQALISMGASRAAYGRIINIASTAGLKGYAYSSAYAAAKHGVIGMTRSLAIELSKTNVTVNSVCPGFTNTDIVANAVTNIVSKTGRSEADSLTELTKHNPQARLIEPDEVAETVLWLCSEASRSITGQSISVAGGEVM